MMSKFKQFRLRFVVAVAVLLMAGTGTEAFAQCYTKNLQQAESLYKQGRYAEAKKRFAAAKACPDKPKTNNLDSRIAACNRKIKERSSSSTQPSRRQSTPSTTSRTNSFKITSVSFRNEDIDDNVLNAYGERLCAADVHYLMPRITRAHIQARRTGRLNTKSISLTARSCRAAHHQAGIPTRLK